MAQETRAEELARAREDARLKKDPFPTMAKPQHEETIDALRGWQEPKGAYVLFERRKYLIQPDTSMRVGWGIKTLPLEDRPEQPEKIRYYQSKGYKVLHYAKFPKLNDPDPKRAAKARMYSGETGINPWDEIEKICLRAINGDSELLAKLAKAEGEKQALQNKLDKALSEKENVGRTSKKDA